ncbi:fluoride efflux transporter CrcB [Christensenellaceae bacterium OttesenSCG-928-K19]|nr:fluoride efflux transporter CrcB [Christensenellaceae bacterium OttesenSCG-928-K19]
MLIQCMLIGLGGFAGTTARYLLSLPFSAGAMLFPFGTLLINFLGSFLIGVVAQCATQAMVDPRLYLFFAVGVCGGFTTFSTFSLETFGLINGGHAALGILYAVCSVLLCLAGVWLGRAAVRVALG